MVGRQLAFLLTYLKINLASALEYRVAFLSQCLGMALNNGLAFFFWWVYFDRFRDIGGWGVREMLLLWAVVATAFGLAVALCGNSVRLATLIVQGQLDYYLGLPRPVLPHILISRTNLAAWGDVLFGVLAFGLAAPAGLGEVLLFAGLTLVSMLIFLAFLVLIGSLAFYIGSAEAAASQAQGALISLSTYPAPIYRGWTRVLLFTALPAGLVGHLPVELLRRFEPGGLALLVGAAALFWALAGLVFWHGLRRYESGNLISMRG